MMIGCPRKADNSLQDNELQTLPWKGVETVTLPNTGSQGVHSNGVAASVVLFLQTVEGSEANRLLLFVEKAQLKLRPHGVLQTPADAGPNHRRQSHRQRSRGRSARDAGEDGVQARTRRGAGRQRSGVRGLRPQQGAESTGAGPPWNRAGLRCLHAGGRVAIADRAAQSRRRSRRDPGAVATPETDRFQESD